MKIYSIRTNIPVFGRTVTTFPDGIDEAFKELVNLFPQDDKRNYYGISSMANGKMDYMAAAEQKFAGEADKLNLKKGFVAKGDYLGKSLHNWREHLCDIKDIFHELMQDERADCEQPCVEVYKNETDMTCLVKMKVHAAVLDLIDNKADDMLQVFNELSEAEVNIEPEEGSWTAGQMLTHVIKSNTSIAQALELVGVITKRDADERVPELRKMFLDFTVKFRSPDFIRPALTDYDKELSAACFKKSIERIKETAKQVNLYESITHPAFGEITKLELLHFAVVHMQRHVYQLNNITKAVV